MLIKDDHGIAAPIIRGRRPEIVKTEFICVDGRRLRSSLARGLSQIFLTFSQAIFFMHSSFPSHARPLMPVAIKVDGRTDRRPLDCLAQNNAYHHRGLAIIDEGFR